VKPSGTSDSPPDTGPIMTDALCKEKDVVLVVDDEKLVAEAVSELVEDLGCACHSFNDPEKALSYFEEDPGRITLMIADLTMPGLSGPGLIRKALQVSPGLPIILVDGYPGIKIPEDISSRVRRIIAKPFTKAELLDVMRTAFANPGAAG